MRGRLLVFAPFGARPPHLGLYVGKSVCAGYPTFEGSRAIWRSSPAGGAHTAPALGPLLGQIGSRQVGVLPETDGFHGLRLVTPI